ncbi:uncharacterized protein BJ171DRAFT_599632 [Polychytrium aggregatum]|uniref:uncharacterized protein n=1 Tax=Polychytrium aggregatum TaxID=110093 RepID=UPI0022FDD8C2|nr:uncharacterized protein BJ171DRAFT_599632 [Polychytrium aggregatum]KAI9204103.1 transmembrane protein [Polychytrium aggregatum]
MGYTTSDIIIPARFLTLATNLMTSIVVFQTKDGNILSALPLNDSSLYGSFNQSLTTAIVLSWICFAIQLGGLFSGLTMFRRRSNLVHVLASTFCTVFLSYFVTEAWHYMVYWYIFAIFMLFPTLMELALIGRILLLKLDN